MSTLRDVVSKVRSRHKLLSYDNLITDRVIAGELRVTAILLIKRETNLRKLWDTDSLFTTIPCLQMQEVPLAECCSYTSAKTLSRSIQQLPKIAEGNYQYLINAVTNIEGTLSFKYMPVQRYINSLSLSLTKKEPYYWIQNRYIYLTDPDIKAIKLGALFEEDIPSTLFSPCDCDTPKCTNPLDMDFNLPGYLEKNVIDMVSDTLVKTYLREPNQVTSNDKEND